MSIELPTLQALKDQAKRLRKSLSETGPTIGHSKALEAIAHQYGFKDWNTLFARVASNTPTTPVHVGERVSGSYLGQAFTGRVIAVQILPANDRFRVTLHFEEPVDVVTFDSFSNFRQRVHGVIDGTGVSPKRTSNGRPHLEIQI